MLDAPKTVDRHTEALIKDFATVLTGLGVVRQGVEEARAEYLCGDRAAAWELLSAAKTDLETVRRQIEAGQDGLSSGF